MFVESAENSYRNSLTNKTSTFSENKMKKKMIIKQNLEDFSNALKH